MTSAQRKKALKGNGPANDAAAAYPDPEIQQDEADQYSLELQQAALMAAAAAVASNAQQRSIEQQHNGEEQQQVEQPAANGCFEEQAQSQVTVDVEPRTDAAAEGETAPSSQAPASKQPTTEGLDLSTSEGLAFLQSLAAAGQDLEQEDGHSAHLSGQEAGEDSPAGYEEYQRQESAHEHDFELGEDYEDLGQDVPARQSKRRKFGRRGAKGDDVTPWECEECGRRYARAEFLRRHARIRKSSTLSRVSRILTDQIHACQMKGTNLGSARVESISAEVTC